MIDAPVAASRAPAETICAEIGTWTFSANTSLQCDVPGATISEITFADYGVSTGSCGAYKSSSHCTTHRRTRKIVEDACLGKHACTIDKFDLPGLTLPGKAAYGPQPCPIDEAKHTNDALLVALKVQARCSVGGGFGSGALQYAGPAVYAAAFVTDGAATTPSDHADQAVAATSRRVLLINKEAVTNTLTLHGLTLDEHAQRAPSGGMMYVVEPNGKMSSSDGIVSRRVAISAAGEAVIAMAPFAVAVLVVDDA